MNQYGQQRDQMNQNLLNWKNSQNSNYNKEIYNNQGNYEKEFENQLRKQFQYAEDENNNQIEMNQALDLYQYTKKYDQQFNQEETNYNYENMIGDFSEDYSSQIEYKQQQQSNNSPDRHYDSQNCNKIQKQTNQQQKQDFVNMKNKDSGLKVEFQKFMGTGTNSLPIGSAKEYENKMYFEQDNINQYQDQLNLEAKLNSHVTKRQSSTHANTPSLTSWCENNNINNLNGFTGNNGAITNFQAAYQQNMKQTQKQEETQIQMMNMFQIQQNNNHKKQQSLQRDDENFGRQKFEQYNQNNSSQLSCGNIPTSRLMEGNEIQSGQLSQRNAPKSNPAYESTSSFQKKIIQKQLASHQGNQKVSSVQVQQHQQQGLKQFQNDQNVKQQCNSHNFMNDDEHEICIFCQNSDRFFFDSSQIVSRLYLKYASSQNYYYTRDLNEILNNYRSKAAIHYKDTAMLDEEAEYLKRYYHYQEYPKKSKLLTEYYKFHKDIPRLFMLPETYILNSFHDKKRRFDYYRIAQIIEDENQRNPNRPPKGIVGEKPPLRTNESSEDGKNENGQKGENKESEKCNDMLLGEISSFINRGQGRFDDNEFGIEDDVFDFNEEAQFTDRFIQCINIQIQNSQGNGNSVAAVSTTSLNSQGKKELMNQKKITEGLKTQQGQLNQIQQQNYLGKQFNQQQKLQQQLPTSSSQLQQYEISANAFLNYQKKLEQYKNTKRSTNNQNNNAKLSVESKQQSLSNQPSQQIQEKKKKKITARTDASLTIQELNMKLEEIVTSHSLISNSRIINGYDEDLRQFDYSELDEFLKFLNKKEKENLNSKSTTSNQFQTFNQQNIQTQKSNQNQKDLINYSNPKDMYLAKNNQIASKKNNSQNSQHQQSQLQQNSSSKVNSKNNSQLQSLQQQNQNINYQIFQNDKQQKSNINSQVYQNDTSRYNNAASSNTSSNQQQLLQNNQPQSNLAQQQQLSVTKKVKAQPSKSDILCSDQLRQNSGQHSDNQTPQLNDANIGHYINQQNLSPSTSVQQIQSMHSSQNNINKNQLNQISTSQGKKRLTSQLRLDDIEYFNDNKVISGKQQQHTGSLSVKFSQRDTLNFQQNQSSVRSAREQYPTTTTNKSNMKNSCDSKVAGGLFQQSNLTVQNSGVKQQIQVNQYNNPQNLKVKDQILGLSNSKQSFNQNLNQDQFLANNVTKNNYLNSATSNSFGLKLDTKESQLFTPRQPQIQSSIASTSNQKNLFSKCHQILLSKPQLSPRDSLPSPKNLTNNNQLGQNDNQIYQELNNNQNLDSITSSQKNLVQNSVSTDTQNELRFCQKSNNLKKKQKSQQLQSNQLSLQGNNSANNQTGNNNSLTNNNIINNQNQISNSVINQQSQSIHANQQSTKKGNMKHLSLKLKLDQLNFSKEKANFNNFENISNNQIIKEPLSQRSCSSKNLDQQTPKYNLYEMFKQQISNQAYSQIMLKPEIQMIKPQTSKNSNVSSCQSSAFNMTQQKIIPTNEIPQTINSGKIDANKNQIAQTVTFQDQNDNMFLSQKQQKQSPNQLCQSQNLNAFLQQNQPQLMISSPQPTKSQTINPSQMSPTYASSNTKLMVNINTSQLNSNQQSSGNQLQNYQVAFINELQQNNSNTTNTGVTRTTANNNNHKSAAFIHINNSSNNLQSAKNQLEQQKKVISQQTTRSEANTRKNSQIKHTFEKSQHSTAAIGVVSGANLNSKHVSRNSSLEMNNNQNVLRKKSPQLFKYQQKETKNVYNLVQQLSNNFTQSTPKQTVSARNYQTQRSSINHFDFQKPELTSYASQNQLSQIQQSNLIQSHSYNNQLHNNYLQQGQQNNKQSQQMIDLETIEKNVNLASFNNSASKSMKNQNNNVSSHLNNNSNYPVMVQAPQCQIAQSVDQNQLNSNSIQSPNYLQINTQNQIIPNPQQNLIGQVKISSQNNSIQNQQQSNLTQQQAQQNKVSSPQMTKKAANMHKHTKSENLMNLMIETNIQHGINQPNQIIQTPSNQVGVSNMQTPQIPSSSTNKKNQKNQYQSNSIIPSNFNCSNQYQHPSTLSHQSISSTTQMSPRVILNQNLQVQSSDKQNYCSASNQVINQNNGYGQLQNKKQSIASPLSSRSTQINFQGELFRSTNNSTNNNNSNTNNTNSQHNNNPNSGVYNNSCSMNSQLNNNNVNNNSNNSTTQQINSSLNTNNIGVNNINTLNQINYVGLSFSPNSSNLIQNNIINNNMNNVQKKNNIVQSQMNEFFNIQQQNTKQPYTSSTGATCSSNTNIVSNNLLRTTNDNSIQSNVNKKTKKKSMF